MPDRRTNGLLSSLSWAEPLRLAFIGPRKRVALHSGGRFSRRSASHLRGRREKMSALSIAPAPTGAETGRTHHHDTEARHDRSPETEAPRKLLLRLFLRFRLHHAGPRRLSRLRLVAGIRRHPQDTTCGLRSVPFSREEGWKFHACHAFLAARISRTSAAQKTRIPDQMKSSGRSSSLPKGSSNQKIPSRSVRIGARY